MYSHTERNLYYIDNEFGEIPIQHQTKERIVRFLDTNGVRKGKLKRKAFHPQEYATSGECRLSVHRLEYSDVDHTRYVAISIFRENYRGLAVLQIKHALAIGCGFETCPENGITQHAHIIYPYYEKLERGKPLKTEITDIIEAFYQYVKNNELFFAEKMYEPTEIEIPQKLPEIEE